MQLLETLLCRINDETRNIAAQRGGREGRCPRYAPDNIMQKIDDCKEIRLALTRAGIATRPGKCSQTFRLVVTPQHIYHSL
jgi:hypothetical protein